MTSDSKRRPLFPIPDFVAEASRVPPNDTQKGLGPNNAGFTRGFETVRRTNRRRALACGEAHSKGLHRLSPSGSYLPGGRERGVAVTLKQMPDSHRSSER